MKGMRVKTGHPRSSGLVCRSGRDRDTLGIKVYKVEVKAKLHMGSLGKGFEVGKEQKR